MLLDERFLLFEAAADGGQGSGQGNGEQPNTPPPASAGTDNGAGAPGPVPYERFKQVNDDLKTLKAQLERLQVTQKAAADKEAAEQGKWKELAEQREAELKAERLARTRLEIATKKGIPVDLAARLQGESAEDLEKDADLLLQHLKPPKEGPGVPPAGRGGSPAPVDLANMSPKQIRELPQDKKAAVMRGE